MEVSYENTSIGTFLFFFTYNPVLRARVQEIDGKKIRTHQHSLPPIRLFLQSTSATQACIIRKRFHVTKTVQTEEFVCKELAPLSLRRHFRSKSRQNTGGRELRSHMDL